MWFSVCTTRGQAAGKETISNVITAIMLQLNLIKSEDIKPLFLAPPSGCGSPPGWGSAVGVWGRVCLSKRGAVLPLQGPLGAAPGHAHMGDHQVSLEWGGGGGQAGRQAK